MAASIQILLPLICAVLVNAKTTFDDPFFNTKPFPLTLKSDDGPHEHSVEKFTEKHSSNAFAFNSNTNNPFDAYHSYLDGGLDPYFAFPTMGNMGLHRPFTPGMNFGMPGFNNIFNIPGPNSNGNPKKQEGPNDNNNGPDAGKNPIQSAPVPGTDPKSSENTPPKTNLDNDEIAAQAGSDDKQVGLDKKKDFLIVGPGGNGNNMFLLHENNPNNNGNPVIQPNNPQLGNVVYVPYQPGQGNAPIYQVVPSPTNVPITSQKQFINPFSSVVSNLPTNNNPVNQNNGYILIYFNGQMIQIPGVILNSPQNNEPQNPVQGTNIVFPDTMGAVKNTPTNNMYTAVPNQGRNNVYIAQPNQGTNNMYVAQPNQGASNMYVAQPNQGASNMYVAQPNQGASNVYVPANNQGTNPQYVVQMPGQGGNVAGNQQNPQPGYQPNGAANGYYQPTMTGNQGNLPNQPNNQNNQYRPMSAPINSGSNGYGQPNMMSNQGNNPAGSQNPSMTTYPAVVLPMDGVTNGNQANAMVNAPNHDTAMNSQNSQPSPQPSGPGNDAVALDHNTLSNYGAIPAVMISGFKDNNGAGKNNGGSKRDREANDNKNKEEVKINPK